MLQSLISLEDDDIKTVLDAVTAYSDNHGIHIDSTEGRRAVIVAVDLICGRGSDELLHDIEARLQS